MIFIKHRCNRIDDLHELPKIQGVEIDLRSNMRVPGEIVLQHDAWSDGERFSEWLDSFARLKIKGPIILNTKEDGLEDRALEMLRERDLRNFFFLDTALPTLVRRTSLGEKWFAVRWSKYEPLDFVNRFSGRCDWVWVDCFGGEVPPQAVVHELLQNFKVCIVSPELQTQKIGDIKIFRSAMNTETNAVCTKRPDLWL